jgi:hypothetical protein
MADIEHFHAFLGASLVVPGHKKVLQLPPEFIAPQDDAEKQDCERNAAKRWLAKHGPAMAPTSPRTLNRSSRHPLGRATCFANTSAQEMMCGLPKVGNRMACAA